MPTRTTLSSSPIPQTARPIGALGGRYPRLTLAAAAAVAAAALGLVAVDGDDQARPSSDPRPAPVGERPDIDPRKAAENFHHRR